MGGSVHAWCAGIASVTGRPFTAPAPGAQRQLVQCFVDRGWPPATIESLARDAGAAYAKAFAGKTLGVFRYVEWESSGRPDPNAPRESGKVAIETPPAPYHGGGSRQRERDELRERLRYEDELRKAGQLPPLPTKKAGEGP